MRTKRLLRLTYSYTFPATRLSSEREIGTTYTSENFVRSQLKANGLLRALSRTGRCKKKEKKVSDRHNKEWSYVEEPIPFRNPFRPGNIAAVVG